MDTSVIHIAKLIAALLARPEIVDVHLTDVEDAEGGTYWALVCVGANGNAEITDLDVLHTQAGQATGLNGYAKHMVDRLREAA